jgi:hypothetical protein
MSDTPKPMQGTWTLTAPDGRTWQAESPLRVVAMESRERVPAKVALERIYAAVDETPDPCYDALKKIVRTPAMPFPDPGAHSARAFYEAVHSAYVHIQFIARTALAAATEPQKEGGS